MKTDKSFKRSMLITWGMKEIAKGRKLEDVQADISKWMKKTLAEVKAMVTGKKAMDRTAAARELLVVAKDVLSFGVSRESMDAFQSAAAWFLSDAKKRGFSFELPRRVIHGVRFYMTKGKKRDEGASVTVEIAGKGDREWWILIDGYKLDDIFKTKQEVSGKTPDIDSVYNLLHAMFKKNDLWGSE